MYNSKRTERIDLLARKMQEGSISSIEKKEFEQWYANFDDSYLEINSKENETDLKGRIYKNIIEKGNIKPNHRKVLAWRITSAAAAVVLMFLGLYYFNTVYKPKIASTKKNHSTEIAPGQNKATLTLADGSIITLDSATTGEVLNQSGINITLTSDGQLVYSSAQTSNDLASDKFLFNTVSTPRGGQYQVVLPDGTHVWLNASSTLKYPTSFKGSERNVELNGEAYFEVVSNKKMPFKVSSKNQLIEVIGTHFNVNAYSDEDATKTTLLEGSVKVAMRTDFNGKVLSDYATLKPGQQATISEKVKISNVDTEEAVAWKNGELMFSRQDIRSVMRQISRWYDVEIVYENHLTPMTFSGSISKYSNVSDVLKMLELTGNIHFKIAGRRIIVTN